MIRRRPNRWNRTLRFHKLVDAPLSFVFQWCTDFRDDDDRWTNDLYRYKARIVFRERRRVVREIVSSGRDRNRATELEIIELAPPDRWRARMFSHDLDRVGDYRLVRIGARRTRVDMSFRESWKSSRLPSRARYRTLFDKVWDRYVDQIEHDFRLGR